MTTASQSKLERYIDVILQVGINLQHGQRLFVAGSGTKGVDIALAPFVRRLAAAAYRRGAAFVDITWRDPQQDLIRLKEAGKTSLGNYPRWPVALALEHMEAGDAFLAIHAEDPDLLAGFPSELLAAHMAELRPVTKAAQPFISGNKVNWCVVGAPVPAWAAKVLPNLPAGKREGRLWDLIFKTCYVGSGEAVAAWRTHVAQLGTRAGHMTARQYAALVYSGPGTSLRIGLPPGHIWTGGGAVTPSGIHFVPNLPTEELFTLPHRLKVDGQISSTKPFAYAGATVDGMHLTFEQGRVVKFSARKGQAVLAQLLKTDDGASHLGEVALVPDSSPISRLGVTFHNALYDENAASHLALGDAYRFTLAGGPAMSPDRWAAAGGNRSDVHVDFMIGSGRIDIDGILPGGQVEPVMRAGEWAFRV